MTALALLLSLTTAISGITNSPAVYRHEKPARFTPAEKTVQHQLGDKNISFKVIQYGESVSTCCVNVHDNEATAVQAARDILEREGGLLIKIDNNAQRLVSFPFKGVVYTFDPNRIFSASGIKLTLTAKGKINPLAITEVEKICRTPFTIDTGYHFLYCGIAQ